MTTIQYVVATALRAARVRRRSPTSIVDLYARGAVRAAVDEGGRAPVHASTRRRRSARTRADDVLDRPAGRPAPRRRRTCTCAGAVGVGHRDAPTCGCRLAAGVPDWSFSVDRHRGEGACAVTGRGRAEATISAGSQRPSSCSGSASCCSPSRCVVLTLPDVVRTPDDGAGHRPRGRPCRASPRGRVRSPRTRATLGASMAATSALPPADARSTLDVRAGERARRRAATSKPRSRSVCRRCTSPAIGDIGGLVVDRAPPATGRRVHRSTMSAPRSDPARSRSGSSGSASAVHPRWR